MLSLCLLYLSVDIVFSFRIFFDNSNCYYIYTIRLLLAKVKEKDHYPVYTDFRLSQDQKIFPKRGSAQEPLGAWAIDYEKILIV